MKISFLPNSEIEVFSLPVGYTKFVDSGAVSPLRFPLDIKKPVETDAQKPVSVRIPVGWGRLHRGKGTCRRGTRRRVQRLGGVIDRFSSDRGLVRCFVTLTCPGSSRSAIELFSSWTGKIIHSLHNWIQKKQERFTGEKGIVRLHCWELQKRGAEHLHACYCVSPAVFEAVRSELREWYFSLLTRISKDSGADVFERDHGRGTWKDSPDVLQVRVEAVTKSVSAYLSKYLGKTLVSRSSGFSLARVIRPARLWGCSRLLNRLLSQYSDVSVFPQSVDGSIECISQVVSYLEGRGCRFSLDSWRDGLGFRVRVFFSGDDIEQSSVFTELIGIAKRAEYVYKPPERRLFMRKTLIAKAKRIVDDNKKRTAFADAYGDATYAALFQWFSDSPTDRFLLSLAIRALEDFDEVTLLPRTATVDRRTGKKKTPQQLRLELYPGGSNVP